MHGKYKRFFFFFPGKRIKSPFLASIVFIQHQSNVYAEELLMLTDPGRSRHYSSRSQHLPYLFIHLATNLPVTKTSPEVI
jgi:hypothetical protein